MTRKARWVAAAVMMAMTATFLLGADAGPQKVPVGDLGSKFVLIGMLGKPYGTYMVIEGKAHAQPVMMANPFDVDTIDGVKLDQPVLMEVNGVRTFPADTRCVLRGYETGGMGSTPEDPLHKESPGPQQVYHFASWFVVTEIKDPATLATEPATAPGAPAALSPGEQTYYRDLYARYKTAILPAAKAGDSAALAKATDDFAQSVNVKLFYVYITRIDGPDKYTTVLSLQQDKSQLPPAIKYADHSQPHVTKIDGYILLETNHLPQPDAAATTPYRPTYADNLYIKIGLSPLHAAPPPAPQNTAAPIATDRLIQALKDLQTIKVGMTRADLLKVCTTEGGLFSRTQQSFVYRSCPIIKVAVTFKPIGGPPDQRQTQPSDEITDISKPYLELPVRD